jgi:hypothetical protein
MGAESTVIHCNRGLAHQVEMAYCLRDGFKAKGIDVKISNKPDTESDIHIVMGPWFAFQQWRHANTLMIDRAYWGDPDCVAIHWLKGGEKVFLSDMPHRDHPELQPLKKGKKRLYICDYGQKPEGEYDAVRYHPAQNVRQGSLEDALAAHQIAIGKRSTALVDAAIHGLRVRTTDRHSPVYGIKDRHQWIHNLAWHNWSKSEIKSGDFLDAIGTTNAPD